MTQNEIRELYIAELAKYNLTTGELPFNVFEQLVNSKTLKLNSEVDQEVRDDKNYLNEFGQRIIVSDYFNPDILLKNAGQDRAEMIIKCSDNTVQFVTDQINLRNDRASEGYFKSVGNAMIYELNTINCGGARQTGGTTAIARMFNVEKDVYVSWGYNGVTAFAERLQDIGKVTNRRTPNFKYSIADRANNDAVSEKTNKLIKDIITSFFSDKTVIEGVGSTARLVSPGALRKDIDTLCEKINSTNAVSNSLRGKAIDGTSIIWVDLGGSMYLEYATVIKRTIEQIMAYTYASSEDKNNNIKFPFIVIV